MAREKISMLDYGQKKRLREQVKENVLPYTNKGVIKFPWQIVIVTAKNP